MDRSSSSRGNASPKALGGKRKAYQNFKQHTMEQGAATVVPAHATLAKARAVDVVGFVESRSFEINALQRSLEAARTSGNARAFQTLPRHLRRRAASHNVKRIPVRLREKAISEMKKSAQSSKKLAGSDQLTNGKRASRYKRRRTKSVREEYELRQKGKRWLETHVWHAKRMHMKEMWGTMIAETPNERSHRAAYRAAMDKTYIQDASYYATIEITGSESDIIQLLRTVAAPTELTISMKRYIDGSRAAPLTLHRVGKYPLAGLGPAVALWRPVLGDGPRTLWLRAHPANASAIVSELGEATKLNGFGEQQISVSDISAELVSFELLGNQSTPMLAAVLGHAVEPQARGSTLLQLIRGVPGPACLPEGVVIALQIHDPRLRFPYKLSASDSPLSESEQRQFNEILMSWPTDAASSAFAGDSGVWNHGRCAESLEKRLSEHELNERRRRQLVPGTKLDPDPSIDVTVPLILVCSGPEALLGSQVASTSSTYVDNLAHGWTLIAPKGWGMPLLLSFVFAGARAQGLQERQHIGFEAGLPTFPANWPGTSAYDEWEGPIAADDYQRWIHRPPGKRVNYLKFGVESPFFPPFHRLLGMPHAPPMYPDITSDHLECRMNRLQKIHAGRKAAKKAPPATAANDDDSGETSSTSDIWLVTGERLTDVIRRLLVSAPTPATAANADSPSFSQWAEPLMNAVSRAKGADMACRENEAALEHCLVRVRLICAGRGTPAKNACICALTNAAAQDSEGETSTAAIGYVMTGSFSLARGCGMAIGACSLRGLYNLWLSNTDGSAGSRSRSPTVRVKSLDGGPDRKATLTVLP